MKVGVCEATELKKRSEMLSIPFADLLWGYAVEDLMLRVSTSAYREFLWLMSLPLLGEEAYRQRAKKRIRFFYKGSEEELTPDKEITLFECMQQKFLHMGGYGQENGLYLFHWMERDICICK